MNFFSGPALAVYVVLSLAVAWLYWLVRFLIEQPLALISLAAIVLVMFVVTLPTQNKSNRRDRS